MTISPSPEPTVTAPRRTVDRKLLGPYEQRFWSRVDKSRSEGCWPWTGALTNTGYGHMRVGRVHVGSHRIAYALTVGPVSAELTIDHLCRVKTCCNPSHLELVTMQENLRRRTAMKVTCKHGHQFDGVEQRAGTLIRRCSTCRRESNRRYREKKAAS